MSVETPDAVHRALNWLLQQIVHVPIQERRHGRIKNDDHVWEFDDDAPIARGIGVKP